MVSHENSMPQKMAGQVVVPGEKRELIAIWAVTVQGCNCNSGSFITYKYFEDFSPQ